MELKELKRELDFLTKMWMTAFSNNKLTQEERLAARQKMDECENKYFAAVANNQK